MAKRSSLVWCIASLYVAAFVGACSGSSNPETSPDAGAADGSARACTPGHQVGCTCPGGFTGVQICTADGQGFGACMGCGGVTDAQLPAPADAAVPDADAAAPDADAASTSDAATASDAAPGTDADAAGASEAEAGADGAEPDGDGAVEGGAGSCATDNVTLAPGFPWTMPPADTDDYVCYAASVPVDAGVAHVLGITPNVVNGKIVAEMTLFQADPSASIGTTPSTCTPGDTLGWRIVSYWAPGGGPLRMPPGVGFSYDATTKWVVQIHYANPGGLSSESDTSGFSFCSTDLPVKYDSDVIAFGTQNISIAPASSVETTASFTVPAAFAGIHVVAAFPHMRALGQAIQTERALAGGGIASLGERVPWNVNAQGWSPIDTTLNVGDAVKTRCVWQNTTSSTVTFGPNESSEVCYSFTAYYPRVSSASWSWSLPAISSTAVASPPGGLPAPDAGW